MLLTDILRTSQQDFTEYSAKLEIISGVIMKICHGNKIRLRYLAKEVIGPSGQEQHNPSEQLTAQAHFQHSRAL
jgi:hypothetical protein